MRYLYVLILFFSSGYTLSQARVETSEINIFFENNSSSLSDKAKHEIAQLSNKIIKENNGSFSLEIIGFTDSIGSEKSNKRLSEARAKAVYNEFMSHANSEEGIQQTIISDWFPSSCYDHMYDTSEFVVPIKYHGDGIYLNEGKPTRYQSKNLSGFRRVVIKIEEHIPNWEWGVLYSQTIPNADSIVYFSNGTRMILDAGTMRVGDYAMSNMVYNKDTLNFSVSFEKTRSEVIFRNIIDYKDSLYIILGKAHVDSFPIQSFDLRCKSLTSLIKSVKLRIPVADGIDTETMLFTNKPIKSISVKDSNRLYLECNISDTTVIKKQSLVIPGGKDAWKRFLYEFYYDVTIDVIRDTIFLTKPIHKKDCRQVSIRFRGRDTTPVYLKYNYIEEPIQFEFSRIKNYWLFFRQYEATVTLYDEESDIKVWITNPKNSRRFKKKRLKSFKVNENNYLIRQRKL